MRLKEEEWARVAWRWRPVPAPAPRPFDLEACIQQAQALLAAGYKARNRIGETFPPQLTREEAWFWLRLLERAYIDGWYAQEDGPLSESQLRAAHAAGCPPDQEIRAWALDTARRPGFIYYNTPHLLRPFFTPAGIADLILAKCAADATDPPGPLNRWHQSGPWRVAGFGAFVAPYLPADTRASLRGRLEQLHDAEADRSGERAWLLIALLATVGGGARLAAHVAAQPDGAWAQDWCLGYDGYLHMLAGLPDEASFVREARRLGCHRGVPDLTLWLAATEWRELDIPRDGILGMSSRDMSIARARLLERVEAPEAAPVMLQLLLDSKAPAVATAWLAAHPLHVAVGLTPVAMGQGRLAQAAREQLATMMRSGQAQVLAAAMQHLTAGQGGWLRREILAAPEALLPEVPRAELPQELGAALAAIAASRTPRWVVPSALPPIRVQGGRMDDAGIRIILAALAQQPPAAAGAALCAALKTHADPASLDAFAWRLFNLWLGMGAPPKDQWALRAVGCLGGDACVLQLTPLLAAWPGGRAHRRAVLGLACLAAIGSDCALMALSGIAQKLKYKALRQRAREMMEDIAHSRGLTPEQLADRTVPDCGLDARGSRVFDLGSRSFRFVLGPALQPQLRDAAGRLRGRLPAPARADDPARAAAARAAWQLFRKQLALVLKVQAARLEDAMISGRRWSAAEFQTHLVRHPLMINLVRQLVLCVHDDKGRLTGTCRVTEDQTLADHNDEEITLPQGAQVGVAHAAQLPESLRCAWAARLADYGIVPPFPQLGRALCRPDPQELDRTAITSFREPKLEGIVLYGMLERAHWLRDTPADSGAFVQHSRYFPAAQLTAFISYTPGLFIESKAKREAQQLAEVYFVPGHIQPACWGRHDRRIRIRDVHPVVLSEVLRLAQAIVDKASRPAAR